MVRKTVIKYQGVRYGINKSIIKKVIELEKKGLGHRYISSYVHLPQSHVYQIIKNNRRDKNG